MGLFRRGGKLAPPNVTAGWNAGDEHQGARQLRNNSPVSVVLIVDGEPHELDNALATVLAENLRRHAARPLGDYGVEGARVVADAIEDRLVGRAEGPITMTDIDAEAVFYALVHKALDPRDDSPAVRLWRATRVVHHRRLS